VPGAGGGAVELEPGWLEGQARVVEEAGELVSECAVSELAGVQAVD
jgi:hypothetical protein